MKLLDSKDLEWEDPPRSYYYTAVKQKVLWEDQKTGAIIALLKFPVGVEGPVHSHPEANQFHYALSGEIMTPDGIRVSSEGVSGYCPKGVKHGGLNISKESIGLYFWDGPPTVKIEE
jgi:quercetin dioxygenase-like cupin family protein